ncbi:patatin-like phospholipase [Blastomonas natatoria]|uniref:Patatin-like phospholipase n=1 Tax=Blastomonas natatoria TaxID=34015 RepID=A0A2V3UQN8_9SPHN|nr:patatin-like phospholipase [Blastomonas natatoria]
MPSPFRVLSIDGGGMRGLYSASFLAGISQLFERERETGMLDIGKGFDLIVGTSTGAILGCAAAVGEPMSKVAKLYKEHGKAIFPIRLPTNLTGALMQAKTRPRHLKNGDQALRAALVAVLQQRTIAQVYAERGIALAIPAVEMGHQRSWVFKTPHLGGHRDDHFTLVDVCMASSAAPIFRSLAAIQMADGLGGHRVFADGGLWANNPVLVALLDALQMAPVDREIEIFALGTCPRPEGEAIEEDEVHRGLLEWKLGGKALQLSLSAQEFAFDNMARLFAGVLETLGRKVSIIRFPNGAVPPDTLQYLDLDDARPEATNRLLAQARADVVFTKSACDDKRNVVGQQIARLFRDMPPLQPSPTGE